MLFTDLPDDILTLVLSHLGLKDVLNMLHTCKHLHAIGELKSVWINVLREGTSRRLPAPQYCRPLDSLSGLECKALALHSWRLCDTLFNACRPFIFPLNGPRSITWVQLVQDRWLFVASSDGITSVVTIWSIPAFYDGDDRAAGEVSLEGPVKAGVCEVQDGRVLVALELCREFQTVVVVLALTSVATGLSFARLARFDDVADLRTLHGHRLGVGTHRGISLPSVVNWKTGNVTHLLEQPNVRGGAVAMTMNSDLVCVVFPDKAEIFSLRERSDGGGVAVSQLYTMRFSVSVGFASARFVKTGPTELRLCLSGEDGLYLYAVSEGELRCCSPGPGIIDERLAFPLSPDGPVYGEEEPFYFCPLVDPSGAISWLQGPAYTFGHSIKFVTLPDRLTTTLDTESEPVKVFVFRDPHSMAGMGVYDYDAGLGIGIFGNMYGELLFVDFSASSPDNLRPAIVSGCFTPLTLSPIESEVAADELHVPASFGLPFPYSGCQLGQPTDDLRDQYIRLWRSHSAFPRPPPPDWNHEPTSEYPSHWLPYIPRLPVAVSDRAWLFEHASHYLGTFVPLIRHRISSTIIFYVGGLYIVEKEGEYRSVAPPGMPMGVLLDMLASSGLPYIETFHMDGAARQWGDGTHISWELERGRGRNRWEEMKQRGGIVHPTWTNNLPPPLPESAFQ